MGAMCLDWYSRKPQQRDKRTGGSSVLRQGMGVKPKPITKAEMELFGIKRWSKREALGDLERAGLTQLAPEAKRLVPILVLEPDSRGGAHRSLK